MTLRDISEIDSHEVLEYGTEFTINGVVLRVMNDIPKDGCRNCYGYSNDEPRQNAFCIDLPECGTRVFVPVDKADEHTVQLVAAKLGS